MRPPKKVVVVLTISSCLFAQAQAQEAQVSVQKPEGPVIVRPYQAATVPPIRLANSEKLHSLLRAGKLYLTVQDALALAIENNLDLEVDRYGPLSSEWTLQRLQAGGPLRGVTSGNSLVNQVTGGQGVLGSEVSAGLASGGGNGGGGNGNAVISQIGPVTQNLDAVLQSATAFSHTTMPQSNAVVSQTDALVDSRYVLNTFVQQGLVTGGYVQVTANSSYLKENTPTDVLNPSVAPVAQIYVRHNLLNSFGIAVNNRFIRVAENNVKGAHETFRSQLLNLMASVLNLYWDLVADNDVLRVRQRAVDTAQKFHDDTENQIKLGFIAKVEIYRARAELATRKRELGISIADVRLQENQLKNALIRDDRDPALDAAEIVPLDHIEIPQTDELPPLRQLVTQALAMRPDVALLNIGLENGKTSALGTANGVLPTLQVLASTSNTGLAGTATPNPGQPPAPAEYVGGIGTALGQVVRRDFPSNRAAVLFQSTIGNRLAQGDYGVDQLQLRQNDLVTRRTLNQLVVDISNQTVALRQARARYATAADSRILQQQLVEKEHERFSLGASTTAEVIAAEKALVAAQAAEITALSSYSHARVALDQVLGATLERNHISSEQASQGPPPQAN
jgi:outer membrane protein